MIIGLIILALLAVNYKFGDCDKCKFRINNTNYGAEDFMNIYDKKCLAVKKAIPFNFSIPGINP